MARRTDAVRVREYAVQLSYDGGATWSALGCAPTTDRRQALAWFRMGVASSPRMARRLVTREVVYGWFEQSGKVAVHLPTRP